MPHLSKNDALCDIGALLKTCSVEHWTYNENKILIGFYTNIHQIRIYGYSQDNWYR